MITHMTGSGLQHTCQRPTTTKAGGSPGAGKEITCIDELRRLQQENRQLRQELEDAHYRIRELEASQRNLALFIPSVSYDSDNVSVEVQSVPSVTSSTTTVPTGSCFESQHQRLRQEKRDEHIRLVSNKAKNRFWPQSHHRQTKAQFIRSAPSSTLTGADLRRLLSSDESDADSISVGSFMSCTSTASSEHLIGTTVPHTSSSNRPMRHSVLSSVSESSISESGLFIEI